MKTRLSFPPHKTWLGLAAVLLLVGACATIRQDYSTQPSYAFSDPAQTTLGRAYVDIQAEHPGESGFRLLNSGSSALLTRAAMADLAVRTIDLQYYIFDADDVGAFMLERLVAAADRGVRVRMLFDDQSLGLDDEALALIDAHPNIEVRLFNPFPGRARWSRILQLATRLEQLGKRMHNKVYTADGQMAVLGGRNISNRYFEGEGDSNFRDFDVFASGPVVKEVGAHFDIYWNSPLAVPIGRYPARAGDRKLADYIRELQSSGTEDIGPNAEYKRRKAEFERRLLEGQADLIWAKGTALAELPVRNISAEGKALSDIGRALAAARRDTTKEMVIENAYFVPGDRGVEVLAELVRRGVRVRILTNSLATNDVVPVHAGYARYRPALLEAGVELHEYRVDAPRPAPQTQLMRLGRSDSALHAKAIVYDRRLVWIGSANLDPRSRRLNTEAGFLIESEALAERVLKTMERDFTAENSWRLTLEVDAQTQEKRLYWNGVRDGRQVRLDREPDAGLLRPLSTFLYSLVVPEDLL